MIFIAYLFCLIIHSTHAHLQSRKLFGGTLRESRRNVQLEEYIVQFESCLRSFRSEKLVSRPFSAQRFASLLK